VGLSRPVMGLLYNENKSPVKLSTITFHRKTLEDALGCSNTAIFGKKKIMTQQPQ
jgi:hypothetical protein